MADPVRAAPAPSPHREDSVGPSRTNDLAASSSTTGGSPPTEPLVALDDIRVDFATRKGLFRSDSVRAIDGVSIGVARRETLALVGESGSGKTTLGRVSLRLIRPNAGRVVFDGRDVTSDPDERLGWLRRRAQMVFQDPFSTLNPYMRIAELVEEPLVIDGVASRTERRQRVLRALEAVDLIPASRIAQRYPSAMSGGQRQRVGIARALVRDPEYIVADEPVSMIDASSRIGILDLLRAVQTQRDVAFLYITHDIASARHFAHRIAVMYRGEIVESGRAAHVIDRPVHPYTRNLIAAVPEPDPANRFRRRAIHVNRAPDPNSPIHLGCPHGANTAAQPLLLAVEGDADHLVACHQRTRPTG